jgi:hypothetical protein
VAVCVDSLSLAIHSSKAEVIFGEEVTVLLFWLRGRIYVARHLGA